MNWLAAGRWFSPGTLVSSTDKTDRHDIAEILLKVALNTIKPTNQINELFGNQRWLPLHKGKKIVTEKKCKLHPKTTKLIQPTLYLYNSLLLIYKVLVPVCVFMININLIWPPRSDLI